MKQITINLYSFSELKPEIQKKVLEKLRDINVDSDWWSQPIIHNWQEKLEDYGFMNPNIHWSGFYSQGDGACFDADIDLEKVLHHKDTPEQFKKLNLAKEYVEFIIRKTSYANHYSHKRTRYIDVSYDLMLGDYPITEESIDVFSKWLEATRLDLSEQIYKDLETNYKHLTSDESIIETINANEYTFEENGIMRNE